MRRISCTYKFSNVQTQYYLVWIILTRYDYIINMKSYIYLLHFFYLKLSTLVAMLRSCKIIWKKIAMLWFRSKFILHRYLKRCHEMRFFVCGNLRREY
jgi:hypothetical protein